MNVAYINPFIQGAQSVCNMICHESPALGQLFVKESNAYISSPVTVSIDIIGAFSAEIIYNMQESVGCFIASKMMGGFTVNALDEMSSSALAELANIISGNVATLFSGKGIKIDISPPRFKQNAEPSDFPLLIKVDKVICIPLKFKDGQIFEIDIVMP